MIIDSRDHVASLVAVFLALGVGIIIGSVLAGESFALNIVSEQESLIKNLEKEYQGLKQENRLAQAEIKKLQETAGYYQQYAEEMLPYLVENRLAGKRIVLLEREEGAVGEQFRRCLEVAGASIVGVADIKTVLETSVPQQKTNLLESVLQEKAEALDAVLIMGKAASGSPGVEMLEAEKGLNSELGKMGVQVLCVEAMETIPQQVSLIYSLAGLKLNPAKTKREGKALDQGFRFNTGLQ